MNHTTPSVLGFDVQPGANKFSKAKFSVLLAVIAVLLISMEYPFGYGVSSAIIPQLILLPMYASIFNEHRAVRIATFLGVALVSNGALLYWWSDDGLAANAFNALFVTEFAIFCLANVYVILWAGRFLSARLLIAVYGFGLLLNAIVVDKLPFSEFKFALSLPSALIGGAALASVPGIYFGYVLLAIVGVAFGARSFSAFVICAPLLHFVGAKIRLTFGASNKSRIIVLGTLSVFMAFILYRLGTNLLLSGTLGEANRLRTAKQITETGGLLSSARPEWFATFALMRDDPAGKGPGAAPSLHDLAVGRNGLEQGGFRQGGVYINEYMFGGHYNLHSTIADLWINFGLAGLLCGLLLFGAILFFLLREVSSARGLVVYVFICVTSLWYLLFGPLTSNLPFIVLAFALGVQRSGSSGGQSRILHEAPSEKELDGKHRFPTSNRTAGDH